LLRIPIFCNGHEPILPYGFAHCNKADYTAIFIDTFNSGFYTINAAIKGNTMKTYKKLIKRKIQSMLKISVTIAVITGLIGFISGMMQGAAFAVSLNSGLISALLGFLNPACIFIFEDFLLSRRSIRSLSLPLLLTIRILLYLIIGIVMYTIVGIAFLFVKKLSVTITEKYTNMSATVLLSYGMKKRNRCSWLLNVPGKF